MRDMIREELQGFVDSKKIEPSVPKWLNISSVIGAITLLGMVVGFFVTNNLVEYRVGRVEKDIEIVGKNLESLDGKVEKLDTKTARIEGRLESPRSR